MKYKKLSEIEKKIIENGGTELPGTGKYENTFENGIYVCKRCNAPLFRSKTKFRSGCGWPSFDLAINNAVLSIPDKDGVRTEIRCKLCGGHLGHVFTGENYTKLNTRYCVNSLSLVFVNAENLETAYFAGGCFWGIEYHFGNIQGVLETEVGYMGGSVENPDYKEVCTGKTNHTETVRILFDNSAISFEKLAKDFFEIHDPTQLNRQGFDVGSQYRSLIFYTKEKQKLISESLVEILKKKNYNVVTEIVAAEIFWKAENYHQKYLASNGGACGVRVKRF